MTSNQFSFSKEDIYTDGQYAHEKMFNITSHQGNATVHHTHSHPLGRLKQRQLKAENSKCPVGMWRNWHPRALLVGYKVVRLLWKKHGGSSRVLQIELLYSPAIPHLSLYPKESKAGLQRYLYTCCVSLLGLL